MQFNKGDRVKFLNDTGGGIITGITGKNIATVLTGDGFEIPMPISELIPDSAYENRHQQSDQGSPWYKDEISATQPDHEEEETDAINISEDLSALTSDTDDDEAVHQGETSKDDRKPERNLFIAFAETEVNNMLDGWLINDSSFNILYTLLIRQDEFFRYLKSGMIGADTKIFIKRFTRDQVNAIIVFRIQALFFVKGIFDPLPPLQKEITISPLELYQEGSISANDYFNEKAFIIPVVSDSFDREVKYLAELEVSRIIAGTVNTPEPGRKKTDPLVEEVDLHIEELVDDHSQLSGREVLDLQMARFTTALDGAIRSKTRRMVFIHGVGNGKLKFEIRKTLDRKYPRLKYQDASFEEYGYGATMVIIRR
jgi:hypothetical protein